MKREAHVFQHQVLHSSLTQFAATPLDCQCEGFPGLEAIWLRNTFAHCSLWLNRLIVD